MIVPEIEYPRSKVKGDNSTWWLDLDGKVSYDSNEIQNGASDFKVKVRAWYIIKQEWQESTLLLES